MKLKYFFAFVLLAMSLGSCGNFSGSRGESSRLKHFPVGKVSVCESDVFIEGDPHANIRAQRLVILPELREVTLMGYETRAYNLSEPSDIFNETYRVALKNYDYVRETDDNFIALFDQESRQIVGKLEPLTESPSKARLTLGEALETLNCR